MRESRSNNRPSNKRNDKQRHKDVGLVVHARQCNRRERYAVRHALATATLEQRFESLLDKTIASLCKEAGI